MLKRSSFPIFITLLFCSPSWAESQCFALFNQQSAAHGVTRHSALSAMRGEEEWFKDDDEFTYMDTTYHFSFTGQLSKKGVLTLSVYLADPERGIRSVRRGDDLYEDMIEHFGVENIHAIEGSWWNGTNYEGFINALNSGAAAQEAALQTWSGKQAKKYGFETVATILFREEKGKPLVPYFLGPAMPAEIVVRFTME